MQKIKINYSFDNDKHYGQFSPLFDVFISKSIIYNKLYTKCLTNTGGVIDYGNYELIKEYLQNEKDIHRI